MAPQSPGRMARRNRYCLRVVLSTAMPAAAGPPESHQPAALRAGQRQPTDRRFDRRTTTRRSNTGSPVPSPASPRSRTRTSASGAAARSPARPTSRPTPHGPPSTGARVVQTWRNQITGILLSIAVPLWAGYGNNHLAAAASGYYDAHFVAMAHHLVAAGLGHSVLRLGWEFNGSWFGGASRRRASPTSYANRARQFAQAWRHIVTAIRHVKGDHFEFDWCVSAGPHYGI